jgi:hypothetical protein
MNSTVHTTQKEEHLKLGNKDDAREKLIKLLQGKKLHKHNIDLQKTANFSGKMLLLK